MDRNSYKTKYSQALDIEYADKSVPKSIEAEQVVLGANDKYIGLCRRHWNSGDLGPDFKVGQ